MNLAPIPVYKAEKEAGLAELINAAEARVVRSYCQVFPAAAKLSLSNKDFELVEAALASNRDSFDLYPIYSVLASVCCNSNDDVFEKYETWAAKDTPEDKPFNLEHKPRNIIGHITSSCAVDVDMNIIPADISIDELPDKYHILTSAVVYRHIKSMDEDLEKEAAEVIASIQRGEQFVSMEALFRGFDYVSVASDGATNLIRRDATTAFLTKHLRAYGGSGVFENNKICRLLRGITFSGKGLTTKPANPESVIITDPEIFQGFSFLTASGEQQMNDSEKVLLEAKVADLETRLAKLDEEKVQAQIAEYKAKADTSDLKVSELTKKLDEVTIASTQATEAKVASETEKTEIASQLATVKAELDGIKAENVRANRVSTLVDKGVDKAAAEELVKKFSALADEQFTEIVTMQAELAEAKKKAEKPEEKTGKEGGGKCDATETDEDPAGEAAASETVLEDAKTEEVPAMTSASTTTEDEVEQARASLAGFLGGILGQTK